jgi:hypothetical protein
MAARTAIVRRELGVVGAHRAGARIENRPLAEFVAWVAREHGWQVRFADDALQSRAADIRLHGSLDPRDGAAMLERVALVTGVPLSSREGVLWVGK